MLAGSRQGSSERKHYKQHDNQKEDISVTISNRREFIQTTAALASFSALSGWGASAAGAEAAMDFDPSKNIIAAPSDSARWPAFREALASWRLDVKAKLKYSGALHDRPEFAWSASNYSCCFLMMCDETFYDRASGRYTVDAFLAHGQWEFGGYDSVVLWHAYPRIGFDERNQFDYYRDQAGGLKGLREAVAQFHDRNVRVFIDYNPWDTGTRREGTPDLDVLVEIVRAIDADGIFLDTMPRSAGEFRGKLDAARPGAILEGELALPMEDLHNHHASWAQGFSDSEAPGVLRHKWLERRHMQHHTKRWNRDHTAELQAAWMNGSGMMIWENVFGSWVPWSPRDRSIVRAMLPIQRRYTVLFQSEGWVPLVPTEQTGVYASLWENDGLRLWTLVNRTDRPVQGALLKVHDEGRLRFYDLIAGREVTPRDAANGSTLAGEISPRGIGCFLAAPPAALGPNFSAFLTVQAATHSRVDFDATSPGRQTRLVAVAATSKPSRAPDGMVEIPAGTVDLTIEMRARECGFYESTPSADRASKGNYKFATRLFPRRVSFQRFAIDRAPVTNVQFAEFLRAANYRPKHSGNFLKHWFDGKLPTGKEYHPIVFVDLDDARAYAKWAGKRLPTEEEWQYAAQGPDGLKYPWGNQMQPNRCNNGETEGTTPVTAFPEGRSPFGCYDMCGNVWQWTESERSDGRTRFCILRSGSYFAAKGSGWYVDGGPRAADFATKFLMTHPGLDRSSTIGFRCVMDLAQRPESE